MPGRCYYSWLSWPLASHCASASGICLFSNRSASGQRTVRSCAISSALVKTARGVRTPLGTYPGLAVARGLMDWVARSAPYLARIVRRNRTVDNVTTIARGGRERRVLIQRRLASQLRGRPTPARPAPRWVAPAFQRGATPPTGRRPSHRKLEKR